MSDFENKQDVIDSMAEMLMLNFCISLEKAYEVMEVLLIRYSMRGIPGHDSRTRNE